MTGLRRRLFPDGVVVVCGPVDAWQGELCPEEAALIRGASTGRVQEFTAGRLMAREALTCLGLVPGPVLVGPGREPLWPEGAVGSITHSHGWCAAAAALGRDYAGLGIDAEPAGPLDSELLDTVLTPGELDGLQRAPEKARLVLARAIFSARESVFKCLFPLSRAPLEPGDLCVRLSWYRGRFFARLPPGMPPPFGSVPVIEGRFLVEGGRLLTAVALSAPRAVSPTPLEAPSKPRR